MRILIISMLFLSSFIMASNNGGTNYYVYIEVETNCSKIYDDGIYRNVYSGFVIKNLNGEQLIKVGNSLDNPAIIKIERGEYIISQIKNDKSIENRIIVENQNMKVKF